MVAHLLFDRVGTSAYRAMALASERVYCDLFPRHAVGLTDAESRAADLWDRIDAVLSEVCGCAAHIRLLCLDDDGRPIVMPGA